MTAYARRVVSGKEPAGKYHRLSCQRHLDDLKRAKKAAFPYRFDEEKATEALKFFPRLRHYKGKRWSGKPFELIGWQIFVIGCLYGWVEKKTGLRRFDLGYIEVPKKSGKTFTGAAIGIKQGFFDREPGAEVYSVATMREQAARLWSDARAMVEANPALQRRINTMRGVARLVNESTASFFQPLGRDSNSADGVNPYCVIADELHRHRDDQLINVMADSMAAREEPLMLEITTAGIRTETSVGWKHHLYAVQILEGIQENDRRFVFVAGADEEDRENERWRDEKTWIKANPSWGISVNPKQIRQAAVEAAGMPDKLNDFLRFHLNLWVEQHFVWIPAEKWAACKPRRLLADLAGRRCYAGLDLGQTDDLSALVLAFRDDDAEDETYDILPFFWVPEPSIQKRVKKDKVRYDLWVKDGYIYTTPKPTTDYSFIKEKVRELMRIYDLAQIWYDPAEATQLANELEEETGNPDFMVVCYQTARNLHEATSKISELVETGNLRHGNHPVLRWMNSNVTIRTDAEGHLKIDKRKSVEKVDGMTALVMALKGWIFHRKEELEDVPIEIPEDGLLVL